MSPDGSTARFDATQFGWVGNASKDIIVPFVWSESPVKTFEDLLTTPVRMGANETNTDNSIMATLLIRMFKAKIELFNGYPGSSSNLMLAIQNGELDGLAGMPYSSLTSRSADLIRDHKLRFLAQMGLTKLPELADAIGEIEGLVVSKYPDWSFDPASAAADIARRFGVDSLKGFGFEERAPEIAAASA